MAKMIREGHLRKVEAEMPQAHMTDPHTASYPNHPPGGPSDAMMEKSEHPSQHALMDKLHHKGQ